MNKFWYVGYWFYNKYSKRAKESGDYYGVAKALRKQGVPLDVALIIIFGVDRYAD